MNLIEALQNEIKRNTKLVEIYKSVPNGAFAAMMISQDIRDAELAIANGDTVAMIRLLQELHGMTIIERAEQWIADSGDDTEELQEAAAIMRIMIEKIRPTGQEAVLCNLYEPENNL